MTEVDQIELKKRSRRRLVGAAALALLAAIVLPMVMDEEPRSTPSQDIQVSIPDRDADSALARPIGGRSPSLADSEPTTPPTPPEAPPVSDVAPEPPVTSLPPPSSPPVAVTPPPKPVTPPPKVEEPPRAVKPPTVPPPDESEAERVRSILEGGRRSAAPSAPQTAGGQRFIVQIGAFGDAGKASSLVSDLKSQGFAAYTEQAGAVTRVRVGPFSSRQDADRAVERLRSLGMSGVVSSR